MTDYKSLKKYEKSQINGLTKCLAHFRFGPYTEDLKKKEALHNFMWSLKLNLVNEVYEGHLFHFETPKKITQSQTTLGKNWLKNYFFKKDGTPRKTKNIHGVSERVLSISKHVSRFEFIGVLGCVNSFGEYVQFLPIYRTYNRKGEYFDYAPIYWGTPVIMEGF